MQRPISPGTPFPDKKYLTLNNQKIMFPNTLIKKKKGK